MVTRIAAGLVALSAMVGLAAYWTDAWAELSHNPLLILWVSAAYFTDLSNLLVAAAFATFAARGSTPATQWSLGLAVTIMLVLVTGYFGVLGGAQGFGTPVHCRATCCCVALAGLASQRRATCCCVALAASSGCS